MDTPGSGRTLDPSGPGDGGAPRLSVILPVLDEARDLGALLDQLREQELPGEAMEVLVADGGSRDGTRDLVLERSRGWPALRLLDNPGRRSGPGRNVGLRASRGDYVVFLDGHCSLPRTDYLKRLLELFESTGADCLCRPQPLTAGNPGPWGWAIAAARASRLGHNPGSDIYGARAGFTDPRSAGAAYRRGAWKALGGYDERFDACEDVEFNHRLARNGGAAYVHPDLAVRYRPRDSVRALFAQMRRYGRGRGRLFARHPDTAPVVLLALTLAALIPPALAAAGRFRAAGAAAAVLALAWAGPVIFESVRLGRSPAESARLAAVFPAIHAGLLLGFWRGLLEAPRFRPGAPGPPPHPVGEEEAARA